MLKQNNKEGNKRESTDFMLITPYLLQDYKQFNEQYKPIQNAGFSGLLTLSTEYNNYYNCIFLN
jgi:hypothetical protein